MGFRSPDPCERVKTATTPGEGARAMKRAMFLFLLAALSTFLFATGTGAVGDQKSQSMPGGSGTGALSVSVTMLGEKDAVYRAGAEVRLLFQTTQDAYVVVYNIDANGYVSLLYPEDGRPVLSKANTTTFLPPPGKNVVWETSGTTGIEYIHALAVADKGRLDEDELYFLSRGDRLPEEKRLRIDSDPFLAFNTIDGEIVSGAESDPPATDFEHFFVNKRVEYPRYLCSKCHSPEKLPDPYAMQCPEIVIEEIAYENEPRYPYPPLYDVKHVGTGGDYSSDSYADSWLDEEDEGGTDVHMTISYEDYNPYASYGSSIFFYDPFWWGFGWSWWWGYDCWYGGWYGGWYPPYYYGYPYWGCGYDYYCGYYDPYYGYDHGCSPVYQNRELLRRNLNYTNTNEGINRTRTLDESRLSETRNRNMGRDVAQRLERSDLQRKSMERSVGNDAYARSDRSAGSNREMDRKIIHGGDRAVSTMRRTGDLNRSLQNSRNRSVRESTLEKSARTQQRINARRDRDAVRREQARDRSGGSERSVDRRSQSSGGSGDADRNESARSRSSGSSSREGSRSVDRSPSRSGSGSSPARSSGAPARGGSSGGHGSSGGSSRSSGAPSGHRR